ncbi:hypothetical protein [Bradyrhizobium sp. SZCCHNS3053]|uniref:hypothetical protein n=1 Tax=Bradyrhizobium sp. SZCCHNS3053 TaxID=3057322 RepID=UPI002916697D|nr:hypothetical protein [Bradyrhizobium sp. SZCCHNS3053]
MFYLVRLDRAEDGSPVETPLPDCGTFANGVEAAKEAKAVSRMLLAKVQCRRIAQAGDWRVAFAKRFEAGELTALPPAWDLPPVADHFAHRSLQDPTMIGYIANDEHGIINKITVTTPGRYISEFYSDIDDDKRRHLIATIDPSGEIFFATTQEEIERVYREGPPSCMGGAHTNDFAGLPAWPSAPYAAGDIVVAYQLNAEGRIQTRATCWPAKKLFGRMFGDYQRMKPAMEAEGWTWIREGNTAETNNKRSSFVGARLLKIPTGNPHEYLMPYFDDIKVAIDMGDHFVTAEQGEEGLTWIVSGGTKGRAVLHRMCPKGKKPCPVTEMKFVHGANEEWGGEAIAASAFLCEGSGKYWSNEHKVTIGKRRLWSKEHFELHGDYCSVTLMNWPSDEMVQIGDRRVHKSAAVMDVVDGAAMRSGDELQLAASGSAGQSRFADAMVRTHRHSVNLNDLILGAGHAA